MIHYVPASLENVTTTVAYVVDKENEAEIKGIIKSANSWCTKKMTEVRMAKDMMLQLQKYNKAANDCVPESACNETISALTSEDGINDWADCH
mmetsp:Transcript_18395/g.38615  ORF Transcript_18395/g.38615 Transcript_18395/m.38615 type:complete len:93 (-) Transcript_18395:950-1228(-)